MPTASERITIAAVGDVSTGHEPPGREFEHVLDRLRAADLRFAQAERVYSDRGQYQEQVISKHSRQPPRFARAFKSVPFDVVSIASNHTGSWGPESVIDTARWVSLPSAPGAISPRRANRRSLNAREHESLSWATYR